VRGDHVLLLLLPAELVLLELTHLLQLVALAEEPVVGLLVGVLQVLHVLLPLHLSVVVHLEWALGTQEIRVCLVVVLVADLVALQGQPDDVLHLLVGAARLSEEVGLRFALVTVRREVALPLFCSVAHQPVQVRVELLEVLGGRWPLLGLIQTPRHIQFLASLLLVVVVRMVRVVLAVLSHGGTLLG